MKTALAIVVGVLMLMAAKALGQMSATAKPGQAVLLKPVALTIQTSGGKKGSATFPKGRHVQVVETSGQRSKIAVANLAEGWVDNSALELIVPDTEATSTAVSAEGNTNDTHESVARAFTSNTAAVKLKKPQVRTEMEIQEGEERKSEGNGCYDQKLTYNFKVFLSGITPQEQELYKANTFVLLEEKRMNKPEEKQLRMIALKEVKDAKNSFNYYYTKWGCSCCRWLNPKLVGHAVLVKDMQGNVVATYKTDLRKKEQEFLEEKIGQTL